MEHGKNTKLSAENKKTIFDLDFDENIPPGLSDEIDKKNEKSVKVLLFNLLLKSKYPVNELQIAAAFYREYGKEINLKTLRPYLSAGLKNYCGHTIIKTGNCFELEHI